MPLVSWKVVKEEQQILCGLWKSMVWRDYSWTRMSLFSTIWKMDQSLVSSEKNFRLFLLELSCLLKELNLKILLEKSFSIDPRNPCELIQETDEDMNSKKIVNHANPTDNEDAANKMLMKHNNQFIHLSIKICP